MNLRVGINLQMLRPGQIGGMEVYVRQLVEHLPELDSHLTLVLFCADYNASTFNARPGVECHVLSDEAFHQLNSESLATWELDVWFCPLLTLEPPDPGLPSVITIPDLQHHSWPEFFSHEILKWRRKHYPRSAHDANRVLTLSEFSRREIIEQLAVSGEKVTAIPLAAGDIFLKSPTEEDLCRVRERYGLPRDYLFFPAHAWPHKNHSRLFQAISNLRQKREVPDLVLTGPQTLPDAWPSEFEALGLSDHIQFLGHVPGGDLPALYSEARGLILPSLFEGFGLPVLEAMALGCPVLCSASTSLPEVANDAALYFDPEDPAHIAQQIERLLDDAQYVQNLRLRGVKRAGEFSWRRTAERTLEVLRSAATQRVPLRSIEWPWMTIITPSYQQSPFIERTIDSVLEQDYPKIEYRVVDGGSDDGTVEILKAYRLRYPEAFDFVSEPDRGQAHAVNKGWSQASGEVLGWLNSDDTYQPGALRRVAEALMKSPEALWLYGQANYVGLEDEELAPYPTRLEFDWKYLAHECFICQPAAFLRRRALDHGFFVDENLQTCMDYDLWIRLGQKNPPITLDALLASSRMYDENKTVSLRKKVFAEIFGTVKRHYGVLPLSWTIGKAHHWLQDGDPIHPSPAHRLTRWLGFWLHLRYNWDQPHHLRSVLGRSLRRFLPAGRE